jgi:hypothetical protein
VRWLALAASMIVLAVPATAAATNGTVERARVTMTVEPNGIIDVLEQRLIHSAAPYTAVFDLLMRKGELFAEPAVAVGGRPFRAGDSRAENTFVVSTQAKGIRIAWRQPAGTHSASVGYRLALRGIAYRDVVDLRVVLWNGGSLRRLDATVALPRAPRRHVYAWLQPKSADANVTTAGRKIVVHARNLAESLLLRVAFPRGVLDSTEGTVVRPQAGLRQILADERRSPHNRNWAAIVAGVALGAGLVAFVLVYRSRRRNS